MNKPIHIAGYCASSDAIPPEYFEMARELGRLMAERGAVLVYGGGRVGLMGAVSLSVHKYGGKVIGVIPYFLERIEIGNHEVGELILTDGMRERKAIMEERADAFITLPGGFGTLEEIFEIVTGRQLGIHQKPIVIINTNNFFGPLLEQIRVGFEQHFIKPEHSDLIHVVDTPAEALDYIFSFKPSTVEPKISTRDLGRDAKEQARVGEVPGSE
jgi:uncharacterized protein (TIGR00730 family)